MSEGGELRTRVACCRYGCDVLRCILPAGDAGAFWSYFFGQSPRRRRCAWPRDGSLCKVIYVNLRRIVEYEVATGYTMNFLTDTFFPPIPDAEKLVA